MTAPFVSPDQSCPFVVMSIFIFIERTNWWPERPTHTNSSKHPPCQLPLPQRLPACDLFLCQGPGGALTVGQPSFGRNQCQSHPRYWKYAIPLLLNWLFLVVGLIFEHKVGVSSVINTSGMCKSPTAPAFGSEIRRKCAEKLLLTIRVCSTLVLCSNNLEGTASKVCFRRSFEKPS
jgi:hypothetical protein